MIFIVQLYRLPDLFYIYLRCAGFLQSRRVIKTDRFIIKENDLIETEDTTRNECVFGKYGLICTEVIYL